LGPGAFAPGDVFFLNFTGGTPSGCYTVIEKIVDIPTDGSSPISFYLNCGLCEAANPTPTPTPTQTPTPTELVFLAQENYFTIQQENGFNILVT
jgi:hypothetical protein